jgi:hypothetical protein
MNVLIRSHPLLAFAVLTYGLALIGTTIGAVRYPFNHAFDVFARPAVRARSPAVMVTPQLAPSRQAVSIWLSF